MSVAQQATPARAVSGRFTGQSGARAERRTPPVAALAVVTAVAGVSLLAVWFVLYALFFSRLQEQRSQSRLYDEFREQLAAATAPLGGVINAGSPVALLDAPGGGVTDEVVVEGTGPADLVNGPGHLSDTPLPGQAGVTVLFGRSATYGAPFAQVTHLQPGNPITVTTGQGTFRYLVDQVRRAGDPLPSPLSATQSRLTLVTTEGGGWRSGWAPQRVVYVDATLHGRVQPAPAGRPTAIPPSAEPMGNDTSTLVLVVLWLQALLLTVGGMAFALRRWGRWQVWIVGLPVVLAVLWGASGAVTLLLPNLV